MSGLPWVLLIALLLLGGWGLSVRLYPWKTCRACGGRGRIQGGGGIHRDCGKCGAKGRVRRFGARGEK